MYASSRTNTNVSIYQSDKKDAGDRVIVERQGKKEDSKSLKILPYAIKVCSQRCATGDRVINVKASDFENATHLLVDVVDVELDRMEMNYNLYGTMITAFIIPFKGKTGVYYKTEQLLAPRTRNLLGLLSRHYVGDEKYYYNDICSIENLTAGCDEEEPCKKGSKWRHSLEDIKNLDRPKISGEHHIHFRAEEAYQCVKNKAQAREALRLPEDTNTAMMAGFMLWLGNLSKDKFEVVLRTKMLEKDTALEVAKTAKELSVRAKSYQNIVIDDLRDLFEADVLLNRSYGSVDWEAEKQNRTRPKLADLQYDEVFAEAYTMFKKRTRGQRKPTKHTWKKFWRNRWQWVANGSVHSQYKEDEMYISSEREQKNKFIAFNAMGNLPVSHFLQRKAEIQAWASVKYEWAKQRAIYGTDITSYVLAHFAFYNCEDTLPVQFPVGNKARPAFVRRRTAAVLDKATAFCIDFEDFNSQHSVESMQAVIAAYIAAYKDVLEPEQIKAAEWTYHSVSNMIVNNPNGDSESYEAKATLLSGWRLTTFINSVLNYLYTRKLVKGEKYGCRSIHNGDDVLVGCRNFALTQKTTRLAQKHRIRLQQSKCAFGGIAEFLRVDHVRGDTGQYLTRNISTLVHSRIESKIAIHPTDIVEAMEMRFGEFITRGGSMGDVENLRNLYYNRVSPLYKMSSGDFFIIKYTHRVCGGISERKDASTKHIIISKDKKSETEITMPLPGVGDYASELIEVLQIDVKLEEMTKRVENATLSAIQLVRGRQYVEKNLETQRYGRLAGIYGAYKGDIAVKNLARAKTVGFGIDVLELRYSGTALCTMVREAKDPIQYLSVVT